MPCFDVHAWSHNYYHYVHLQDWDDYGIDWDGPIPHVNADDDNTVVVQVTDDVLSLEQKTNLNTQLSLINPTMSMTEELLVNQFTKAKMFVHSCLTNTSNSQYSFVDSCVLVFLMYCYVYMADNNVCLQVCHQNKLKYILILK